MEAFGIYLLKVSALMGIFYLAYLLFLRKETFFNSNRWFLLAGLITSMVMPFITYTKVIWVDPAPVYDYSEIPQTYVPVQETGFEINWFMVMAILYGVGIAVFLIKFLIDCYAIKQLLKDPKAIKRSDFYMIDTDKVQSPFSFFNYIVYNSSVFKEDELENILQHEQVHSAQKHSWDMMIAQIFCIAFWINPIVWLYKKAIAQNLEFIADAEATKNIDDIKSYQKTLLKVTMQSQCIAITNPFYQSLIKKRIVMLNSNQSNKRNSWKYFVVLPLLAFFMFQFQMKVLAQEKSLPRIENRQESLNVVSMVIDKNSSDAEIKKDIQTIKKESGVTLKVSKVKRNSNGEITAIKVDYKDKDGRKGTTQVASDEPIQPIHFFKETDQNGKGAIGFGAPRGRGPREALAKIKTIKRLNDDGEDVQVIVEGDEEGDFDWADMLGIDPPLPPDAPDAPDGLDVPSVPDAPGVPKAPRMVKKNIVIKQNGDKKEVWINGEKVTEDVLGKMDFEEFGNAFTFDFKGPKGPKGEKGSRAFILSDEDGNMVISRKEIEKIRKEAMDGARIQVKEARKRMEEMRPELERSKIRVREVQPEMEKVREEMQKAKEEMLKAKEELQKAKIELEKAKSSVKDKKA